MNSYSVALILISIEILNFLSAASHPFFLLSLAIAPNDVMQHPLLLLLLVLVLLCSNLAMQRKMSTIKVGIILAFAD